MKITGRSSFLSFALLFLSVVVAVNGKGRCTRCVIKCKKDCVEEEGCYNKPKPDRVTRCVNKCDRRCNRKCGRICGGTSLAPSIVPSPTNAPSSYPFDSPSNKPTSSLPPVCPPAPSVSVHTQTISLYLNLD